jgi:hypothetical protein
MNEDYIYRPKDIYKYISDYSGSDKPGFGAKINALCSSGN